jgi:AraC family transcriptional regulator, regulatory protein of adaptative response / DNA-3-methyladenine glycosylase II
MRYIIVTMNRTEAILYGRIRAKRNKWDGRFITGVVTTGIYCLPSCSARKPKRENVCFFRTKREASGAGLRPCKRCRPDLFYLDEDPDLKAIELLAEQITREPNRFADAASLAASAGLSQVRLTELFFMHFHTSPTAFLCRARVANAAHKLLTTDERIHHIGSDLGFESEVAFHRSFLAKNGLTPNEYRALRESNDFVLHLPLNYREKPIVAFHCRDTNSPTERRIHSGFVKVLSINGRPLPVEITFGSRNARCCVSSHSLLGPAEAARLHNSVVRMLGLDQNPKPFEIRVHRQLDLPGLIEGRAGLRVPLTTDVFEAVTWAIVGQQINVSFASYLRSALASLCGEPHSSGLKAHPTPERISELAVGSLLRLKFSRKKAEYLIGAARAISAKRLLVETLPEMTVTSAARLLRSLRGFGPWTTEYIFLRGCGFADCVPLGDSGLTASLQRFFALKHQPQPREAAKLMMAFSPYRSLATCHLWARLTQP